MIGKDRAIKLLAISIGSADFNSAPLSLNRNMLFCGSQYLLSYFTLLLALVPVFINSNSFYRWC
ncbi:MAG: hypothetical protein ACXWNJ_19015 [Vulcanimicrobiaceae bacterium]